MTWKQVQHWDKRIQAAGYTTQCAPFSTMEMGQQHYWIRAFYGAGETRDIYTVDQARKAEREGKKVAR